jgi:uncharacterized protein YjdB
LATTLIYKIKVTVLPTTIILDANTGTPSTPTSATATYGSVLADIADFTVPAKDGYAFGGFTVNSDGTGGLIYDAAGIAQADVSGYTGIDKKWTNTDATLTLYAKWTENTPPPPGDTDPAPGDSDNVPPDDSDKVPNVTAIRVPVKSIVLQKGKSITIPYVTEINGKPGAAPLTWTSSNPKVATVANGKITAKKVKKGSAVITAKAENGKAVSIKVTVASKGIKVTKLTISKIKKTMKVKQAANAVIKISPAKATITKIKFSASGAIKVDKAGRVTAVKKGNGRLTVAVGNKKTVLEIKVK